MKIIQALVGRSHCSVATELLVQVLKTFFPVPVSPIKKRKKALGIPARGQRKTVRQCSRTGKKPQRHLVHQEYFSFSCSLLKLNPVKDGTFTCLLNKQNSLGCDL